MFCFFVNTISCISQESSCWGGLVMMGNSVWPLHTKTHMHAQWHIQTCSVGSVWRSYQSFPLLRWQLLSLTHERQTGSFFLVFFSFFYQTCPQSERGSACICVWLCLQVSVCVCVRLFPRRCRQRSGWNSARFLEPNTTSQQQQTSSGLSKTLKGWFSNTCTQSILNMKCRNNHAEGKLIFMFVLFLNFGITVLPVMHLQEPRLHDDIVSFQSVTCDDCSSQIQFFHHLLYSCWFFLHKTF